MRLVVHKGARKLQTAALSNTEAEYTAIAEVDKKAMYLKAFVRSFDCNNTVVI